MKSNHQETQKDIPIITCEIVLLPFEEGGRNKKLDGNAFKKKSYMPHLVVGDINQRKPKMINGNQINEPYLGILFIDGPQEYNNDEKIITKMQLLYYPQVDYSALTPNTTFTIREGGRIVGYGKVITRTEN